MIPKQRTLIVADTAVTFYEHEGKNRFLPPLIFLHGWRSEARVWGEVITLLAKEGYSFYIIDLPGFGNSDLPGSEWGTEEYVQVVRALIKKRGLLEPTVIGHSFGGQVAIRLAAESPELVDKLILVNSAGVRGEKSGVQFAKFLAGIVRPLFRMSFMKGLRESIYNKIGAEDYVARPELKAVFSRVTEEDVRPLLPKIQAETLLIWGSEDKATPLAHAQIMEENIPHAALVIYDNAGHFSFIDEPQLFVRDVASFTRRNVQRDL